MDCSAAKSSLYAYVDGELAAGPRGDLERHLAACRACQRLAELELAFREVYVERLRPEAAPAAVRKRVQEALAALRTQERRAAPRRWRWRLALGAAALLLLAAGAGLGQALRDYLGARHVLVQLAEAAVEQHQRLVREDLPPDITGVSPKRAEEWFRKRLPFNVQLPELRTEGLTFLGGRISHLREVDVAALEYRVDGSHVSLFIIPEDAYARLRVSDRPRFKAIRHRGYDVVVWRSHGAGYALVSEIGGRSCLVCHRTDEKLGPLPEGSAHR